VIDRVTIEYNGQPHNFASISEDEFYEVPTEFPIAEAEDYLLAITNPIHSTTPMSMHSNFFESYLKNDPNCTFIAINGLVIKNTAKEPA
jgi:hypothetical protein